MGPNMPLEACQQYAKTMSAVCLNPVSSMSRPCQQYVKTLTSACYAPVSIMSELCHQTVATLTKGGEMKKNSTLSSFFLNLYTDLAYPLPYLCHAFMKDV